MQKKSSRLTQLFFKALLLAGVSAIILAFAVEWLGFSDYPGLGLRQVLLIFIGIALAGFGFVKLYASRFFRALMVNSRPVSVARLFMIALFWALTGGLIEGALHAYSKLVQKKMIFLSEYVYWMAPTANAIILIVISLFFIPSIISGSKSLSEKTVNFVFAAISFYGIILLIPTIHVIAGIILAIGIAAQLSKVLFKNEQRFQSFMQAGFLLAVLLTALTAIGATVAHLPPDAKIEKDVNNEGKPNVLLIVLDTVRSKSMSLYGYERTTTPFLDKLSAQSLVFDNAIATAPWTLPTHASIFTGKYHHEMTTTWADPLDQTHPTLAEYFRDSGYRTGAFVGNFNFCGYESGLGRGFDIHRDYEISAAQLFYSSALFRTIFDAVWFREMIGYHDLINRKYAKTVNEEFISWLVSDNVGSPFFAFLNYYDAHQPYMPPTSFKNRFGHTEPRGKFRYQQNLVEVSNWPDLSDAQKQAEQNGYDAGIAYLDAQIEALFADLSQKKLLENTIVVVTSDHGEQFGENGWFSHGNTLFTPLTRVPLLISFSKFTKNAKRVAEHITLRDLPATIAYLADPENGSFAGQSIISEVVSDSLVINIPDSPILSEVLAFGGEHHGYLKSIIRNNALYIKYGDGYEELYDLMSDSLQQHNLADSSVYTVFLEEVRAMLEKELEDAVSTD